MPDVEERNIRRRDERLAQRSVLRAVAHSPRWRALNDVTHPMTSRPAGARRHQSGAA